METVDQVLRRVAAVLREAGVETPELDTRLLVRQGSGFSDAELITNGRTSLSIQQIEIIEKLAARRIGGEPVSRIRGEREFWGLPFKISPATLDPRPDTETLVEAVLKFLSRREREGGRILDLGTGSGCILLALLHELPGATGVGVDLNPDALPVARGNAAALGLESRAEFRQGSWFEPLTADESFDIIVSNPPYIPESDIESLAREVRNHDPILALSGGKDGLEAYKKILEGIKNHLECGGRAYFEIGQGQGPDLQRLVDDSNMRVCESYFDLAGILRVVEITYGEN